MAAPALIIIETTLKKWHTCRHCTKLMMPGEQANYSQGRIALGHPICVAVARQRILNKHVKIKKKDIIGGDGQAGAYRGGGRVIRSSKPLS